MPNCINCGKEITSEASFCRFCGKKQSEQIQIFDVQKINFFDISAKNNWLHAILLTLLMSVSIFETYIYIDAKNSEFLLINSGLFLTIFLITSAYKGFTSRLLMISIAGAVVAYLFGSLFTLPILVWLLTNNPSAPIRNLSLIKRSIIASWARNGIIWTTIGAVVTLGSLFLAKEGESYYALYGASLVGCYYLIRGAYHSVFPSTLDNDEKKVLDKLKSKPIVNAT